MIAATIVTPGKTVLLVTIATVAIEMIAHIAGNALGRLLDALKSMIVAPGRLRLPKGNMMIEGLQGTMTGGVAMMTEEALTLIMTVVGKKIDEGTIAVGTRGTIVTMTDPRGTPTGKADGRAEFWPMVSGYPLRCGPRKGFLPKWRRGLPSCALRRIGFCCMERSRVSRARRISPDRVILLFHGASWPS